jgi:hypothetical protein
MQKLLFETLIEDSEIVKITDLDGHYFLSPNGSYVFCVFFSHMGYPALGKRLLINLFPSKNINKEITLIHLDQSELIILVNSHEIYYAYTYKLSLNEYEGLIKVIVQDYPELGSNLITEDEKNGYLINGG